MILFPVAVMLWCSDNPEVVVLLSERFLGSVLSVSLHFSHHPRPTPDSTPPAAARLLSRTRGRRGPRSRRPIRQRLSPVLALLTRPPCLGVTAAGPPTPLIAMTPGARATTPGTRRRSTTTPGTRTRKSPVASSGRRARVRSRRLPLRTPAARPVPAPAVPQRSAGVAAGTDLGLASRARRADPELRWGRSPIGTRLTG